MFREANASDEGEYYHRFMVIAARITALERLGEHLKANALLSRTVNEARATDNILALLLLSAQRTRLDVAADRAGEAAARLEREHGQLPRRRVGLLHAYHAASVMRVGCATGDHDWALRLLRDDWDRLRRSLVTRRGYFGVVLFAVRARLLLNRAVAAGQSAAQAAELVASELRMLTRHATRSTRGVVARTRARLALLGGDRERARAQLEASLRFFDAEAVTDEAARDRYACGVLRGGRQGSDLQAAALDALGALGYVNPLGDIATYYPELFK